MSPKRRRSPARADPYAGQAVARYEAPPSQGYHYPSYGHPPPHGTAPATSSGDPYGQPPPGYGHYPPPSYGYYPPPGQYPPPPGHYPPPAYGYPPPGHYPPPAYGYPPPGYPPAYPGYPPPPGYGPPPPGHGAPPPARLEDRRGGKGGGSGPSNQNGQKRQRGGGGGAAKKQKKAEMEQANMRPSANFKLTFDEVIPQVQKLSKEQDGSRYLQMKLTEGDAAERDRIFEAIHDHLVELAKDQFGNFVVQKLLEKGSEEQRELFVSSIKPAIYELAQDQFGCRVIQKVFELTEPHLQEKAALELHGKVAALIEDMHGNHVLQRCVQHVSPSILGFIIDACIEKGLEVHATHPFGCRVLQRLLERCPSTQLAHMLDTLVPSCAKLAKDKHGNYVVQHLLKHSRCEDIASIMAAVSQNVGEFAKDKCSSNVVEKCFEVSHVGPHAEFLGDELNGLVNSILGEAADDRAPLRSMVSDKFGNYIVQSMLKHLQGELLEKLKERLQTMESALQSSHHGKRILTVMKGGADAKDDKN